MFPSFAAAAPTGIPPDARHAVEYRGDPALRDTLVGALQRVIDPEMSMNIVDLGLVYAVHQRPEEVIVTLTMTSAACPVADMICAEVESELDHVLPTACEITLDLVWEPPWTAERMSARARKAFGWPT
jgi:metal-sulfur cluster biosynthetic enzyme